jgi:YHS domain-containing protein
MKHTLKNLCKLSAVLLAFSGGIALAETPAAPVAPAKPAYPLTTCVVSGETLGEHGKPVVIEENGKEVQFCCKGCVKDFKKDPAKYMSKLDAAYAAKKQ